MRGEREKKPMRRLVLEKKPEISFAPKDFGYQMLNASI